MLRGRDGATMLLIEEDGGIPLFLVSRFGLDGGRWNRHERRFHNQS
jgi:hypothetical protein